MRSKPWWLPSLLLALVLPLAGAHNAIPAPHPDFADALWIAESSRGLKVALSDGRVLFEIPDTGRIEALIVNEEAAVLWAYGEGRLLSYDFAGRRLLALPIDAKGADRHGRSKRAHLALNPLDGSLWLGVDRRLYHFDPTGELLQEIKLLDPIRALSFDRTRTRLWVGFQRSLTAYDTSGQPGPIRSPRRPRPLRPKTKCCETTLESRVLPPAGTPSTMAVGRLGVVRNPG